MEATLDENGELSINGSISVNIVFSNVVRSDTPRDTESTPAVFVISSSYENPCETTLVTLKKIY